MKKVLFIGGSMNQTTMMHQVAEQIPEVRAHFSPFYGDRFVKWMTRHGFLHYTIAGGEFRGKSLRYLKRNGLLIDDGGSRNRYDLVVTSTDLVIPQNIRTQPVIVVQEGMTDPDTWKTELVRKLRLPPYLASTSLAGLSKHYDRFCVASEGYKNFFVNRGASSEKLAVTGIPNFDHFEKYLNNNFPHRDYVLCATTDMRETGKRDDRKAFIRNAFRIANGRKLIFKLHPNEKFERAHSEIETYAPGAIVYSDGNVDEMIANCAVLITQYSTVTLTGMGLGKEVHSYWDVEKLRPLLPLQNKGQSAKNIANVCRQYL